MRWLPWQSFHGVSIHLIHEFMAVYSHCHDSCDQAMTSVDRGYLAMMDYWDGYRYNRPFDHCFLRHFTSQLISRTLLRTHCHTSLDYLTQANFFVIFTPNSSNLCKSVLNDSNCLSVRANNYTVATDSNFFQLNPFFYIWNPFFPVMVPYHTSVNTIYQEYRAFARASFLVDSIQIIFSGLQWLWYRHSFEPVPAAANGSYWFGFTYHNLWKVAARHSQDSSAHYKISVDFYWQKLNCSLSAHLFFEALVEDLIVIIHLHCHCHFCYNPTGASPHSKHLSSKKYHFLL